MTKFVLFIIKFPKATINWLKLWCVGHISHLRPGFSSFEEGEGVTVHELYGLFSSLSLLYGFCSIVSAVTNLYFMDSAVVHLCVAWIMYGLQSMY